MKKRILFLTFLLPALLLTACGSRSEAEPPKTEPAEITEPEEESPETPDSDRTSKDQPAEESESVSLSQSINAMGYDLFAKLKESGHENICFSPYSIETALGMAANGAVDTTYEEMLHVMQINDIDTFNQNITASVDKLESDAMDIRIANSAWYDKNMDFSDSFETSYLPLLKDSYRADCFEEQLSDPSAIQSMNDWIKEATNEKIDNMVDEISPDACLLLFNAVYFNAKWAVPFPAEGTFDEEFYGTDKTTTVPFMHMSDQYFKYYEYKDIRALRMYYRDSDMAMDILIPAKEGDDVTQLFNDLSFEEKQELYQGLTDAEEIAIASLKLPRFEFSSESIQLNSYLMDLGMNEAFSSDAKLDIISEEAYISNIFHKTYIRVDENGTEAAAVTEVMMNRMSLIAGEPVSFEVDMPFMYYISDTSDGTILFMGSMNHIDE